LRVFLLDPFFDSIDRFMFILIAAFALIIINAFLYSKVGIIDAQFGAPVYEFKDCFYFSLVTWTTLGYGDFRPTENLRIIAGFEAFLGYIFLSIMIALLLEHFSQKLKSNKSMGKMEKKFENKG